MKSKILLLDIDYTIYDVAKAKEMFKKTLSKKLNIKENYLTDIINGSYKDLKDKMGFYDPSTYADILAKKLQSSKNKILEVSWDEENFKKCIYIDTDIFFKNINRKIDILIFSTGDERFQTKKLRTVKKYIIKENIYIYKNKVTKFKSLVS
ncbi:MAG: hypothetical protein AABX29_00020, partial [Nanoarchaeota archaeon]